MAHKANIPTVHVGKPSDIIANEASELGVGFVVAGARTGRREPMSPRQARAASTPADLCRRREMLYRPHTYVHTPASPPNEADATLQKRIGSFF
jgi:hypothetical protein